MGRRSWARVVAAAVGLAVGVAVAGTSGVRASGAAPVPERTAADTASAVAAARAAHARVEVMSARTETRQVFANPDGTFTADTTAMPRWVRRATGWVPVDATLRVGDDGRLTTTATPLQLTFSPGGDTELAAIGGAGRTLAMTWPAPLPRPVLDGASAVYPEVLPGVDLRVTAGLTGFSEVLVVKSASAARNPALSAVRFGLRTSGVDVQSDGHGGARAVDPTGAEVFHSPTPQAWDSSTPAEPTSAPTTPPTTAAMPGAGARRAAMPATLAADAITVRPDPDLLTGAATRYPVYIDPQWSGSKLAWTYVDKAYPTQSYWNSTETPASGTYNAGSTVKRSYWRLDTSAVAGKHILKATFRIKENWAYSCTARPVDLYLTTGISSSTTWNTRPTNVTKLGSVTTAKGWAPSGGTSACPAGDIEFDATSTVVSQAAAGAANVTLALEASSETDSYGWKRYENAPHLVVDYNTVPAAPTAYGTQPGTPCVTGDTRPGLSAATPKLYANIYDPDGSNGSVRAEFEVRHRNAGTGAWEAFGSTLTTSYVSTTSAVTLTATTATLQNGEVYSWRTRAYDSIDASAWSGYCEFVVDTTAPTGLPTISSTDYPAGSSFPDAHGSPGLPGAFTFTASASDGVTAFRYAMNDTSVANAGQVAATGGTVTVQIAPPRDQQNTLYVWPVDQAGNVGSRYASYDFFVGFASGPDGLWRADETTATSTVDGSGNNHPVTWSGGVTSTVNGRAGRAATLDGSSGSGATAAPVVRTDRSFSVSAWVRLTSTAHNGTVLAQDGTRQSGFQLAYSAADNRWSFTRRTADADGATAARALSDQAPVTGAWTQLIGVYDAPRQQLRLYVNGVAQATPARFTTPWNATGPLTVGRAKVDGVAADPFAGDVDELRAYGRILLDQPGCDPVADDQVVQCREGIHELATRPGTAYGYWTLDETTGTVAADGSGRSHPATLSGAATWDVDGVRGGALSLDGTSGAATTAGQVLQTDGSFTVTAWVRLGPSDSTALPSHNMTAVGQNGTALTPFYLGYRRFTENGATVGYWSFSAVTPDSSTATRIWTHAKSDPAHAPTPGAWTHLAGVYDATSHELRLYVGGELVARTTGVTLWSAGGAFTIGGARYLGATSDFWGGALDDVRAYAGTLTDSEIFSLASV